MKNENSDTEEIQDEKYISISSKLYYYCNKHEIMYFKYYHYGVKWPKDLVVKRKSCHYGSPEDCKHFHKIRTCKLIYIGYTTYRNDVLTSQWHFMKKMGEWNKEEFERAELL